MREVSHTEALSARILALEADLAAAVQLLDRYAILTVEWSDGVYDQHCSACDRSLEHEGGHQQDCPVAAFLAAHPAALLDAP